MLTWRNLPLIRKFLLIALLQLLILIIATVVITVIQDQGDRLTLTQIDSQAQQNELADDIRVQIFLLERVQQRAFQEVREPDFNPETTDLFAIHDDVLEDIRDDAELLRGSLVEDAQNDPTRIDAINDEFEALELGLAHAEEDFTELFLVTQRLTDPQTGALIQLRNAGSELTAETEPFLTSQVVLIQDLERTLVEVGSEEEWASLTTAVQNVRDETGRGSVIVAATAYTEQLQTVITLVERVTVLQEEAQTSFIELATITERIVTLTRSGQSVVTDQGEAVSATIFGLALILLTVTLVIFGQSVSRQATTLLDLSTRMSTPATLQPDLVATKTDEFSAIRERLNEMGVQRDELEVEMRGRIARATRDLNAAAEVGRMIVEIPEPIQMTENVLTIILESFNFYYSQVFLVNGRTANLVANASRDGRDLSERRYSVTVGADSAVGRAAASGQPVMASEADSGNFHELSEVLVRSRAQLAVPMRIGALVIGVLDVQTDREVDLQEDVIAVFQIIADQLAIALESARLSTELDTLEQRLGSNVQANVGQRWAEFLKQQMGEISLMYHQDTAQTTYLSEPLPAAMQHALEAGELIRTSNGDGEPSLTVPIRIRDQVIGAFNFTGPYLDELTDDDMRLVETVVDRVGLALENLRLVQQATQRAEYEQIVNDITTQIVGSTDVNFILQTTVRELGRILGAPQTSVQLKRGDSDGRR